MQWYPSFLLDTYHPLVSVPVIRWHAVERIHRNPMKSGIHPKFAEATVTCACGNTFTTASVKQNLRVDVCSNCHPFFTGQQRILDSAGRVERFRKRFNIKDE